MDQTEGQFLKKVQKFTSQLQLLWWKEDFTILTPSLRRLWWSNFPMVTIPRHFWTTRLTWEPWPCTGRGPRTAGIPAWPTRADVTTSVFLRRTISGNVAAPWVSRRRITETRPVARNTLHLLSCPSYLWPGASASQTSTGRPWCQLQE